MNGITTDEKAAPNRTPVSAINVAPMEIQKELPLDARCAPR